MSKESYSKQLNSVFNLEAAVNFAGLEALGRFLERIKLVLFGTPFVLALLTGGALSLWEHSWMPLGVAMFSALVLDAILALIDKLCHGLVIVWTGQIFLRCENLWDEIWD